MRWTDEVQSGTAGIGRRLCRVGSRLPGCCSQGATESEALDNISEAIREYLEVVEGQVGDAEIREVEVAV